MKIIACLKGFLLLTKLIIPLNENNLVKRMGSLLHIDA